MIEITNKCNLRCDYCYKSMVNFKVNEMPWDVFLAVKEQVRFAESISFCGLGEQVLHPRYYDMVQALEDQQVLVITNGTVPIDFPRLMAKQNVTSITFSVDGPTEEIARLSCSQYRFRNLERNLEEAARYSGVTLAINYVLGESNLKSTVAMVEFAARYHAHSLNLLVPSYDSKWVRENDDEIQQTIEAATELGQRLGVVVLTPYRRYCMYEGAAIPFITISGEVRPCCDHFNRIPLVGNVLRQPFSSIWETPVYRKFQSGHYCETCSMYQRPSV
jgi:MoaA/NifB/PqqE/SkfB family radical SAM enzyme